MKELDDYFAAEKKVHEYFGYEGHWHTYPLDDKRDCFWCINGNEVLFDDDEECFKDPDLGPQYSDVIISNDEKRLIYCKGKYTMMVVDTQCDGNKFLAIFDNSKEIVSYNNDC